MTEIQSEVAVIGATPGGIAAAVRAAREGRKVTLFTYNAHLGGMMASGLSYTDTLTKKARSSILEEFVTAVHDHYVSTYGEDSDQVRRCEDGYVFEPHVAEQTFDRMVGDTESLSVYWEYRPESVVRDGRTIEAIGLRKPDEDKSLHLKADVFLEATYEGDVLATAGVDYRIGREGRREFNEQFAGHLFTGARGDRYYPAEAVGVDTDATVPPDILGPLDVPPEKQQGQLDLIPHPAGLTEIHAGSTGVGDAAIQAYNYRLCLTNDPDNRRRPEKPPDYDPDRYRENLDEIVDQGLQGYLLLRALPNEKADMNSADLPGENHEYPEADEERRKEIAERHRNHALGLIYFLQNDEHVSEELQSAAREWGLARDEFIDNDNFPWQFYVREARRLDGQYVFSESDARIAPGTDRAPVHNDAIAIAEYPLDSHACHDDRAPNGRPEGFFYASQVTRPSQVPYRSLLPKKVDNLLVPVPLSATHVAYGTIRLEPTWMHIGEAAGLAASLSVDHETPPSSIDVSTLQRRLVDQGTMLTFFNELDMESETSWVEAVQFLGTKGFFDSYHANPDESLDVETAQHWATTAEQLREGDPIDPQERAKSLPDGGGSPIIASEFRDLLGTEAVASYLPGNDETITRGDAALAIYRLLTNVDPGAD